MVMHRLGLRLSGSILCIPASYRRRTLQLLTRLQTASAAALSAFAVVHLSAPLVGLLNINVDVIDRVDAVSRWMLLGRVAYQSGAGEIVLWTSIATHLASGLVKRLITRFTTSCSTSNTKNQRSQEKIEALPPVTPVKARMTLAQLSGWLLAPVALHHAFVNRIIPSSERAPILALSPSELDYSFVSHTLSHPSMQVRTFMGTAYIVLIGAFAVHAVFALPALLRSLPWNGSSGTRNTSVTHRASKRYSKATASWSLATVLLASLISIIPLGQTDKIPISSSLKNRYDAVLAFAWPTHLFISAR